MVSIHMMHKNTIIDEYLKQTEQRLKLLKAVADNKDIFAIVSTIRALLLVNLNTKEVFPLEFNRWDYYGISWFPHQETLVCSHSGTEYAKLVEDFSHYPLSEIGFLSYGEHCTPPFLSAPHQILCASDNRVICTNTGRNAISVLDLNEPDRIHEVRISSSRWDILPPNNKLGDHLNSVFEKNGLLYVIAHGNEKGSTLAILSYPELKLVSLEPLKDRKYLHNIWVTDEGQHIICGSERGELIELNAGKISVLWRAGTPVFTRGLAASADFILVGESQEESQRELRRSSISGFWLLDRKTWKAIDYFCLGTYGDIHEVRILNVPDEAHHRIPFEGVSTLLAQEIQKKSAVEKIKVSQFLSSCNKNELEIRNSDFFSCEKMLLDIIQPVIS